jgi:hypothetical protein
MAAKVEEEVEYTDSQILFLTELLQTYQKLGDLLVDVVVMVICYLLLDPRQQAGEGEGMPHDQRG